MKHALMLLIIFVSLSSAVADEDPREFCRMASTTMAELTEQLPIRLDLATTMVGATAVYINGRCAITYSYLIDERQFLEMTRRSIEAQPAGRQLAPTRQELIEYANSDEGRTVFRNGVITNATDDLLRMARIPFVDVQMSYGFDGGNIRAIQFTVE